MMRKENPVKPESDLPEWKKEVAEKVKAYGERKKRLTTPPGPLRETPADPTPAVRPSGNAEPPTPTRPPAKVFTSDLRQALSTGLSPVPESAHEKKPEPLPAEGTQNMPLEIWTEDVADLPGFDELSQAGASQFVPPGKRIAAGLLDHLILGLLFSGLLFGLSAVMGEPFSEFVLGQWKWILPAFFLIHLIYHLYFFHSSRQTPGMVFLALELRDPSSSVIPVGKILIRWACFLLLNVFNLIPLLSGKHFLLLDRLSGTEVRSFQ